jgi:hypothetical protein
MSINHLALVNQKLAYANFMITQLKVIEPSANKLHFAALADAAVFHLSMAAHFYVREIAERYYIKELARINSVEQLIGAMERADRVSSESVELLSLAQDADSWLGQLTGYYRVLSESPERPKEKKAFVQENLIELVELTESEGKLPVQPTYAMLNAWLGEFKALVIRHRNTSAEY